MRCSIVYILYIIPWLLLVNDIGQATALLPHELTPEQQQQVSQFWPLIPVETDGYNVSNTCDKVTQEMVNMLYVGYRQLGAVNVVDEIGC